MLNNFFNKHAEQSLVQEHLSGFRNEFTKQQKVAILLSLFAIANSDGNFHLSEQEFLKQISSLLGFNLEDNLIDVILPLDNSELINLLNSLSESQKDWYIVTVMGMIYADGEALDSEFECLNLFFPSMGITLERAEKVLKKSILIMNNFK